MRILSYNIRAAGRGREPLIQAVLQAAAADVVVLQEAYRPATVERLASALGMVSWGARRGHSLAFMSRVPVNDWQWHGRRGCKHPFLELELESGRCGLFGVHLAPFFSRWSEQARVREIQILRGVIGERGYQKDDHLIVGDLNAVAPEDQVDVRGMPRRVRWLVWLSGGRIGNEAIRSMEQAGYVDAFRMLHPDRPGHTLPAAAPRVRLDYCFPAGALAGRLSACVVVKQPPEVTRASDHLPLLTELQP